MNQYTKRFLTSTALFLSIAATCSTPVITQDEIINVYGPGGPAPAIQEAAKAFGAANQMTVNVAAGPTNQWIDKAKQDADIVFSGAAKQQWTEKKDIDAWLIWNIWQVANPELAQVVPMDEPFRIYRDAGVVLTHKGSTQPRAKAFVEYLQSPAGQRIFAKWGWDTR